MAPVSLTDWVVHFPLMLILVVGESLPVELGVAVTDPGHALHSHNMAFSSAMIVEGKCVGLSVCT